MKDDSDAINKVLGIYSRIYDDYQHMIRTKTLGNTKNWLAPLIYHSTPKCLEIRPPIEKKYLNIAARFWFVFINSIIMPSYKESILRYAKASCLSYIINKMRIKLGMIMHMRWS